MAGTLYTNGLEVSGDIESLEGYDLIRHSAEKPDAMVRLRIYGNEFLDLSDELGTVGAEVLVVGSNDNGIHLILGEGNDDVTGSGDSDQLYGGAGDDFVDGSSGSDRLDGGAGNDYLYDYYGNDALYGGEGNDILWDGSGRIFMDGGAGDDIVIVQGSFRDPDSDNDDWYFSWAHGGGGWDILGTSETYLPYLNFDGFEELQTDGKIVYATAEQLSVFQKIGNIMGWAEAMNLEIINGGTADLEAALGEQSVILTVDDDGNTVRLGGGHDVLYGRGNGDDLGGGAGNDRIYGRDGNDILRGGDGDDLLEGEDNFDTLFGGEGRDRLFGGSGDDRLVDSGADANVFDGGLGNDVIEVTGGFATGSIEGGDGLDTLRTGQGSLARITITGVEYLQNNGAQVTANIAQFKVFETIRIAPGSSGQVNLKLNDGGAIDLMDELGSQGATITAHTTTIAGNSISSGNGHDTLVGSSYADTLMGMGGSDTLLGMGGDDVLNGGTGVNRLEGGNGNDIYILSGTADTLVEAANAGGDEVRVSVSYTLATNFEHLTLTGANAINGTGNETNNRITGNAANNVLEGLLGNDTLNGGAGDDVLNGGDGSDRLDGGTGADRMVGGLASDTYVVDSVTDTVVEASGGGTDTVQSSITWTAGSYVENITLTGADAINAIGNTAANVLTGNAAANLLQGREGDDTLSGGAGTDRLEGGLGADILTGGADADKFVFQAGGGADRVTDFLDNVDDLLFDDMVWGGGAKTAAEILSFATITTAGAVFDFGNGSVVTVAGVTSLAALENDIFSV